RETNGVQVSLNQLLSAWGGARYWLGLQGRPQLRSPSPRVCSSQRSQGNANLSLPQEEPGTALCHRLEPVLERGLASPADRRPGKDLHPGRLWPVLRTVRPPHHQRAERCRLVRAVVVTHE